MKRFFLNLSLATLMLGVFGLVPSHARAADPFAPSSSKPAIGKSSDPFAPAAGKVSGEHRNGVVPQLDVLTFDQVKALYAWMAEQEDIPFRYVLDGCYARAHVMIKRMQAMGITAGKTWAMDKDCKPNMFVETPYGPSAHNGSKIVAWWYHCAPTVKVRLPDGSIETCVIDPSLFDRPALLKSWQDKFGSLNGNKPYFTETKLGEAPILPNGTRSVGTGYAPNYADNGNLDNMSVDTLKKYKAMEPAKVR
jgi:hypothetical protein